MNEERTPADDSHEPALNPEDSHLEEYQEPSSTGLKLAVMVFVLVAVIAAEEPGRCLNRNSQRLERRPSAGRGCPGPS